MRKALRSFRIQALSRLVYLPAPNAKRDGILVEWVDLRVCTLDSLSEAVRIESPILIIALA